MSTGIFWFWFFYRLGPGNPENLATPSGGLTQAFPKET